MAKKIYQYNILKVDVWNRSIKVVITGAFPRTSRL